ncbi:metal ABC transporter ATP-binding protein [Chloroflexota bacterium]
MEAVRLEDIWVRYEEQMVLREIDLAIEEGEFLGLIGPNGGGKTTLLKVILGLIRPEVGRAEVFGIPCDRLGAKRHYIGYIPQRSLADWRFPASVFDVAMMGCYGRIGLFKRPGLSDKQAVMQCLERVEMSHLAQRQIGELSGGQQQRVFIARALAGEPKLLLLDEPTSGVDAPAQEKFYQLLKDLQHEFGLTVVLVTHDVGVISYYVEKIACLNQTLYAHAPPFEVFTTGALTKAYGCEVELLAHGKVPHRVIEEHK